MTKEQFIALGFTEEQATKAAAASAEELKAYVPKTRFDEVNDAKKQAEKDRDTVNSQLEDLKKSSGASEDLKKQIETLQADNKAAADKYAADLKELTLTNAIKTVLAGRVHDEGLVAGLFDKSKLVIDGDKVVGLEEQLKGLQADKAFLFKPDTQQQQKPGFQVGGGGNPNPNPAPSAANSLKDALTNYFQTKQ